MLFKRIFNRNSKYSISLLGSLSNDDGDSSENTWRFYTPIAANLIASENRSDKSRGRLLSLLSRNLDPLMKIQLPLQLTARSH